MHEEKRLWLEASCTMILSLLRLLDKQGQEQVLAAVAERLGVEDERCNDTCTGNLDGTTASNYFTFYPWLGR